ncbi:5-formyltetrahydrofolate cyclo-ligase [Caloramator quimbayensis]|uniref:5-formyltetrahydrofolate cyclo-ligase n=1 Tax=Caloramator quimbayensis TaxID=1147123 RepID=A0A1T4X2G2_9CLOT|nr:5-formyltetrahydrofolate cyclo-ligase [Caloramator quimbayensis]SKA83780.1 5-formyltetrahydrofolate cyclo-ligase [Caloramator quimbayensis]
MKKEIRKKMIFLRDSFHKEELDKLSSQIIKNIINWSFYKNSTAIMLYSSIKSEVRINDLLKKGIEDKKTIILPKTLKDNRELLPCIVEDIKELHIGNYGILEPMGSKVLDKNSIDIIFVPGVAYDYNGFRIGYGAGYYDRFLKDYKGIKAGVCYSFQVIDDVFHDLYDINMDYLITEKGIIKTGDI